MSTSTEKLASPVQMLARLRGVLNFTQEQAAALLGVSRNYVSMVENGRKPGGKFVSKLKHELLKCEQAPLTQDAAKNLLDLVLEKAPLDELVLRLEQIQQDPKLSSDEKWQFANYIIPKLRDRISALENEKSPL